MGKKSALADFEKSLDALEKLVDELEHGELPLEQALKQFERGLALTRTCQEALTQAERKVETLIEESGQQRLVPVEEDLEQEED